MFLQSPFLLYAMASDDDNDVSMSGVTITSPKGTTTSATTSDNNNTNNSNTNTSSKPDAESKMEEDNLSAPNQPDPFMAVQDAMSAFLNEMTAADLKAKELYQQQMDRQQQLMSQFVADSLRAMHEFNNQLDPIHDVLAKLKKPLEDVLLSLCFPFNILIS